MTDEKNPNTWTKVEKATFAVNVLSLIVSTFLTIGLFFYGNRIATSQWANQKLVEKRIDLYDKFMPLLNDILCYHMLYGNFKELSPIEIIERKRQLDRLFYTQRDFFSENFQREYKNFMDLTFQPFSGMYYDAKIKSDSTVHKEGYIKYHGEIRKDTIQWNNEWNVNFTNDKPGNSEIEKSYYQLMKLLSNDIGVDK